VDHLFVYCPFSKADWQEVLQIVNGSLNWDKNSLMDCFKYWMTDLSVKNHKALPC
jgi:hypothetical protein